MKFKVDSSPHVFAPSSKAKIMWMVVLALIPAAIVGVVYFGMHALYILLVSIVSSVATEAFFEWVRKKPISIHRGSAVVTGLLLGMIIPPTVPLWVPALGSFVAIALAKHAFGGSGNTLFNPALVGRAFLVASFPVIMTRYAWADAVTKATPLTELSINGYNSVIETFGSKFIMYKALFLGNVAGSVGEASAAALLLGGIFLLVTKVIDWKIPTIYIGTVVLLTFLFGQDPLFHVLSGGLMIGAFFMATGYEGMPITKMGRVYFAFGCGLITTVIRLWGGYPEGVNYSILLMNAATPLIERLTISKPFGYQKRDKK